MKLRKYSEQQENALSEDFIFQLYSIDNNYLYFYYLYIIFQFTKSYLIILSYLNTSQAT